MNAIVCLAVVSCRRPIAESQLLLQWHLILSVLCFGIWSHLLSKQLEQDSEVHQVCNPYACSDAWC